LVAKIKKENRLRLLFFQGANKQIAKGRSFYKEK